MPVRYPAALSHTATVQESPKAFTPPSDPPLECTPVVCAYFPERMLERLGAQSAVVTKWFSKRTPFFTRRLVTFCITGVAPSTECFWSMVSQRWSSVRMKTMFGRGARTGGGMAAASGSSNEPTATTRRKDPGLLLGAMGASLPFRTRAAATLPIVRERAREKNVSRQQVGRDFGLSAVRRVTAAA